MTLRQNADKWEKAFYVIAIFVFGGLEIQNLYHDRAEHDKSESAARAHETQAFKDIGDGIKTAIANSQTQFDATMSKVNSTLQASETAAQNSRPIAEIVGEQIVPIPTDPTKPTTVNVGSTLAWNFNFGNAGTAPAKKVRFAVAAYVEKPDDLAAQAAIEKKFEKTWSIKQLTTTDLKPADSRFTTFYSDKFTQEDISNLAAGAHTIYIIWRVAWSDDGGRWVSQECQGYQDMRHDLIVAHPCGSYHKVRYPFRQ
jgi:hypothetical protein